MVFNWNEIKSKALLFSKTWADACNEDSQAKPFWIDFFEIFGITDKRVATFELKNSLTKQTVADAVEQYQRDRDPRDTQPHSGLANRQIRRKSIEALRTRFGHHKSVT